MPKRSHKKGASQAHAVAVQKALQQQQNTVDEDSGAMHEDEMDVDDPNEPRYCYCNRVSFGEMVGCDGGDCKREWFHLECVGLRNAPPKNSELPSPCSFACSLLYPLFLLLLLVLRAQHANKLFF